MKSEAVTFDGLTLYHFPSCPFCQRVTMFLNQHNIVIQDKNILSDSQARDELLQGGGSTQVPCLKIEDQEGVKWLYESMDIVSYLQSLTT